MKLFSRSGKPIEIRCVTSIFLVNCQLIEDTHMPCAHRFQADLLQANKIEYLFVGTFNPEWDRENGDNAEWFYGRSNNDFWYIMPQVFDQPNLVEAQFRNNRQFLLNWSIQNNIGISDLITSIDDADFNNLVHRGHILSVNDAAFQQFDHIIPTNLTQLIHRNRQTLQGVFLTRYSHTLQNNNIVLQLWQNVEQYCLQLNIRTACLVTPSRNYRVINRNQKLELWRNLILL